MKVFMKQNFKNETENLNEMNSEKQKLWDLKEQRLLKQRRSSKKMTQGTTVDQAHLLKCN